MSFLATSRPIPDIIDNFKEDNQLEARATEEDLRRYSEGVKFAAPELRGSQSSAAGISKCHDSTSSRRTACTWSLICSTNKTYNL